MPEYLSSPHLWVSATEPVFTTVSNPYVLWEFDGSTSSVNSAPLRDDLYVSTLVENTYENHVRSKCPPINWVIALVEFLIEHGHVDVADEFVKNKEEFRDDAGDYLEAVDERTSDIIRMINYGLVWSESVQGDDDYWMNTYDRLCREFRIDGY